ncbi:MAG: alanine racemase [Anaerolineae bacterium]
MDTLLDATTPPKDAALSWIEVDLDAIAHNVRQVQAHVGPAVQVMAVVKANAYGHGAVPVALTALAAGAARLAVARAAEGLALRAAGITAPILVLGYTLPQEVPDALRAGLTLTVTERDVAQRVAETAQTLGHAVAVHVKLDTGMGRYGLLPDEAPEFITWLAGLPGIKLEGVFTHFAVADLADKAYTRQQFAHYVAVLDALRGQGIDVPLRHVANSAATLDLPEMHLDAVRLGIALYGLRPSSEVSPAVDLHPALALKSHVARVRTLPAGASISYGRTFITPRAMPVALVPVGYGDGYHRLLSNRGQVLINGRRCPIVGRVCMDQFVVDISGAGSVAVGDEVVLIGTQGGAAITADEVAAWAETINYEVVTALTARLPRSYRTANDSLRAAVRNALNRTHGKEQT